MDHLFGRVIARAITLIINHDDATPTLDLASQVVDTEINGLFRIVATVDDGVGDGFSEHRTHELLAVTGGGNSTGLVISEDTGADDGGVADAPGDLVRQRLLTMPPVDVAAARSPFISQATAPMVPYFWSSLSISSLS